MKDKLELILPLRMRTNLRRPKSMESFFLAPLATGLPSSSLPLDFLAFFLERRRWFLPFLPALRSGRSSSSLSSPDRSL